MHLVVSVKMFGFIRFINISFSLVKHQVNMSNEWAINRGLSWKWNSCSLQLTIQPTLSINHSCIHMHYYCLTCDLSAIQILQRRQNISSLEYTLVLFFGWLVFYIKTIIVEQLIKHKTISVGSLIKDFLKTQYDMIHHQLIDEVPILVDVTKKRTCYIHPFN